MTTRKGYRKSQVAKRYQRYVEITFHKKINLREARKETGIVEAVIKALAPLTPKARMKVVRASKILFDIED